MEIASTELINEGRRCNVYRGFDKSESRPIVVKVLRGQGLTQQELDRFRHEYAIVKDLKSPSLATPLALTRFEENPAIIMDDIRASDLARRIAPHGMDLARCIPAILKIAEAVAALHHAGIIHKDINPRNVIATPDLSQIQLIDFGIATQLRQERHTMIHPELIEGTLEYISPEQTGRVNRAVDARSDLYSLGVTFYQMLTGKLPFVAEDALGWVHCHIAKVPQSPAEHRPDVPEQISNIVLKLLSKEPENRYRSAHGLCHDLVICEKEFRKDQKIKTFPLGQHDPARDFIIPQKLYGRSQELAQIKDSMIRASTGQRELLLVSGLPGIGKSALINELRRPIAERRGRFAYGKFDRLKGEVPYSAFVWALQDLMRQFLASSESDLEKWRAKLSDALGANGGVITEVIAELALIIGEQPRPYDLGPAESKNRFHNVFSDFLRALGEPSQPLVLFIDDLQWADLSTLQLFGQLLADPAIENILFIAAYRENEVTSDHPLSQMFDELDPAICPTETIRLGPLDERTVSSLLQETLLCDKDSCADLASIVHHKTGSNPFFLRQFLEMHHREGNIFFDSDKLIWNWDIHQIQKGSVTDNVMELMLRRVRTLPEKTQSFLSLGALIGNEFDLELIAALSGLSLWKVAQAIKPAVDDFFLFSLDEEYGFLLRAERETYEKSKRSEVRLKFAHDRIQEAVLGLLNRENRRQIHLTIAHKLLELSEDHREDEPIFEIANHLIAAQESLETENEKIETAQIIARAGHKAKRSAAYTSARNYFASAMDLLGQNPWKEHYLLTFDLYKERGECEFVTGSLEKAESFFNLASSNARTILDKARVGIIHINALAVATKNQAAVELGLEILKDLGLHLHLSPPEAGLVLEIAKYKLNMRGKNVEELFTLPEQTNQKEEILQSIIAQATPIATSTNPVLVPTLCFAAVNKMLNTGLTKWASLLASGCAVAHVLIFKDYEKALRFSELAIKIAKKYNEPYFLGRAYLYHGLMICYWSKPLNDGIDYLEQGYLYCHESGDNLHAAYTALCSVYTHIFAGHPLMTVSQIIDKYDIILHGYDYEKGLLQMQIYRLFVSTLYGLIDPMHWDDPQMKEAEFVRTLEKIDPAFSLCEFYCVKEWSLYLFGHSVKALEYSNIFEKATGAFGLPGMYHHLWHTFFSSLIILDLWNDLSLKKREILRVKLYSYRRRLKKWKAYNPHNFAALHDLVEAEYARLHQNADALRLYMNGIESAKKAGFIHIEALGRELAGKFLAEQNAHELSHWYLRSARHCYGLWGASGKVTQMEETFHNVFEGNRERISMMPDISRKRLDTTTMTHSKELDVETVLKASQTISGEVVFDDLLKRLMFVVMECAGAQRGVVLLEDEGQLYVEAEAQITANAIDVTIQEKSPLKSFGNLPVSIIQYVRRVGETVVLSQANSDEQFGDDPYVTQKTGSLLCSPIVHRGKITAILYLENDLIRGAFDKKRVSLLNHICTQIAISVENAKVYGTLEELVRKRTEELVIAQQQLVETAHKAGMSEVAIGVMHNIGNLMTSVSVSVSTIRDFVKKQMMGGMSKASTMFREHEDDLVSFVVDDPQGLKALQYVAKAGEVIERAQIQLEEHIRCLEEQVATVNQMIATQRQYVYYGEVVESVDIVAIAESVCRMLDADLNKAGIHLNRHWDSGDHPIINGQKSKIVQILVNLIRNAMEAMDESDGNEIRVFVESEEDRVTLKVSDQGRGIDKDIKKRLFEQGFSTKDRKRGFGLHISAIFVNEMGGKIEAESPGPDQGSTFSIHFPRAAPSDQSLESEDQPKKPN